MKSWKDVPNLFANGKFKVKIDSNTFEFVGVSPHPHLYERKTSIVWYNYSGQLVHTQVKNCTLIARKIEDMSDEEVKACPESGGVIRHGGFDYRRSLSTMTRMSHRDFLYLLSIGVYPFDQSHFEDGTVIDSATL